MIKCQLCCKTFDSLQEWAEHKLIEHDIETPTCPKWSFLQNRAGVHRLVDLKEPLTETWSLLDYFTNKEEALKSAGRHFIFNRGVVIKKKGEVYYVLGAGGK